MARARATDPQTSHEAGDSVDNVTETQKHILGLLCAPLCDAELIIAYGLAFEVGVAPRASESGIRSRRAELVERGLVIHDGTFRLSPSGRRMMVWVSA